MFKTKKELKEYLKNLEFGLVDYQKTFDKHNDYKTEKFKEIYDLLIYNKCLPTVNSIRLSIAEDTFRGFFVKHFDCKYDIRSFKTYVNQMVYRSNFGEINLMDNNLNEAEKNRFAIKLYLKRYKYINKVMKKALIGIVLENSSLK